MKVINWLNLNFWRLASWAFIIVAVLNFGTDKGFTAALLGLAALAVHETLTALRGLKAVTAVNTFKASAPVADPKVAGRWFLRDSI